MWALAPSASAWLFLESSPSSLVLVKGLRGLGQALVFSSLPPPSATTTGPDIPRLRRQHSLPERIACTVLGRPPPACPSQSLSSCRFAPGQPICLHTHTHTNSGRHPPDEASYRLSLISQHFFGLSAGATTLVFGQQGLFSLLCLSGLFLLFISHTTLSILPYYTILRYIHFISSGRLKLPILLLLPPVLYSDL